MKERPILFAGPMVRALLDGRKTQTRRVVRPQPAAFVQTSPDRHEQKHPAPYLDAYCSERKTQINPRGMSDVWCWWTRDDRQGPEIGRCPYGQPGDRLWVRERIHRIGERGDPICASIYDADGEITPADAWPWKADHLPSIHCPRGLSRITLEVTGVRVERVQEISDADAIAEGIESHVDDGVTYYGPLNAGHASPTFEFRRLWESINGKRTGCSWDANPLVWVVEFRRVA